MKATPEEVFDVLDDPLDLKRWWPSVYLEVTEENPGDSSTHTGRVIELYTKGWLPYTLRWTFTVIESTRPSRLALVAHGDFEGTGVWTIDREGDTTVATYDWRISAEKPLLRYGSIVMRPIFAANHRWAMARGLESLDLELRRRRGERGPAPPGPTFARR